VLIPDHVQLLLTPPSEILEPTLTPSLGEFKEAVVRSVTAINRRPQRIWRPGGGSDRTIFSCSEFREKRLNIHCNAVRAGHAAICRASRRLASTDSRTPARIGLREGRVSRPRQYTTGPQRLSRIDRSAPAM
jgi:hypothetical protein